MSHLYFFIQSVDIFMEIFHLWKFDSKGQNVKGVVQKY